MKKADTNSPESESKFATVFHAAQQAITITRLSDGLIIDVNESFSRITGFTASEVIGKTTLEMKLWYHESDRAVVVSSLQRGEQVREAEFIFRTKSGKQITGLFSCGLILLGNEAHILSTITDITERKKLEESLRRNEEDLSITLNSIGDGVISTDTEGRIVRINPTASRMCGYTTEEAVGQPLGEIFRIINADTREPVTDPVTLALSQGGVIGLANHTILIAKDGTERQIADSAAPIRNKEGIITGVVLVFSDVTEKYTARKIIDETQKKYRLLIETTNEGIWSMDGNARTTFVNRQMASLLGYEPEEMIGRLVTGFMDPSELEDNAAKIGNRKAGIAERYERTFIARDGSRVIMLVSVTPLIDELGNFNGSVAFLSDITERKKAEESLYQSHTMLARTEKIAHIGSWQWFAETDEVIWSEELFNIFKLDPAGGAPSFSDHPKYYQPESMALLRQSVEEALKNGTPYQIELRAIRTDGAVRTIFANGFPERDENGRVVRLYGTVQDVTERKRMETALAESEKRYALVLDAIEQGLWDWNVQTNEVFFSAGWKNQIGYEDHELPNVFDTWIEHLHPEEQEYCLGCVKEYLENPIRHFFLEFRFRHKDGSYRWIHNRASSILDENGKVVRMFGAHSDITGQKKMMEEIVVARQKAEESDRLKTSFLANMSHEIRTPMNAIVGFSSMLSEPEISEEEKKRFTDIIQSRSDDLMHLINDILQISRIESGNMTVEKTRVPVNRLIAEMESVFMERIGRIKKQDLVIEGIMPLPEPGPVIMTDGYILKQVLSNLIDNAVKYTDKGKIRVGYQRPEKDLITFFVSDTGIGIAVEDQSLIFEHFRQAATQDHHKYGGTGLGLSICKGSLELLGGRIWVESTPGAGSIFSFTIPYESVDFSGRQTSGNLKTGSQKDAFNWKGKKIMIVEDEESNMEYLKVVLSKTGADLTVVYNGRELRALLPRIREFDMVLLDVRLPDASGWELAREIKQIRPELPVIAQTAYAMPSDRQMSEQSGCDNYISKPIVKELLLQKMTGYLS